MERQTDSGLSARDPWRIVETERPEPGDEHRETIFSQANGYLGLRGNFCEADAARSGTIGAYLNGFYESHPITYGEGAYGYAKNGQTMLNVTNGQILRIFLGGEPFSMDAGTLTQYQRALSMQTGLLVRDMIWTSPGGRRAEIRVERLVSFENRHLAAYRCTVTPLNFDGTVAFEMGLDGDVHNRSAADDPRVGAQFGQALHVGRVTADEEFGAVFSRTERSALGLCCAMTGRVTSGPFSARASRTDTGAVVRFETRGGKGAPAVFEKFLVYFDTRTTPQDALEEQARSALEQARTQGFDHFARFQAGYLAGFWESCGVEIGGDERLQQGIRYNLFQLLQSAGTDGITSAGSKGLSGEGYEGHYFWDTEMYLTTFFIFARPEIARKLLEYRYRTLPAARARAREMSVARGALYPWRTIHGEECSAYYPAGTAQAHIDGDIAHAVKLYAEATGDDRFLWDEGAEILAETARFWLELGFYNPQKGGKFCINGITGPDEYNTLVNNNCYTNLMAAENLRTAAAVLARMRREAPDAYKQLCEKIGLQEAEPAAWTDAADRIYIPYDEKLGIHPQDDGFLDREPWDFAHTPKKNYPLLLHYHPLVIYRRRVCKQADLVLSLFLFPEEFTAGQTRRDYDFYEPYTTHDSSLSTSIFCIVACGLGRLQKAYRYFIKTARMDLDDCNGNTGDGIHTANMAGTWMGITCGFGGMSIRGGRLRFAPALPEEWNALRFRVNWRGSRLQVEADREQVRYTLLDGAPLTFLHRDQTVRLEKPGETARFDPADSRAEEGERQ